VSVFAFDSALVRTPGPEVVEGLRAHRGEGPSYEGVLAEHRAYVSALEAAGLAVEVLPPLPGHPDAVFVEDPAFVLPEGAVLLRPGAPSRMDEAAALAPILRRRFETMLELDVGFADGGDILILPGEILIGLSARTDQLGARRFVELMAMLGRKARIVETPKGALHLKSGCALLDEETVVATPTLAASGCFDGLNVVVTPDGETAAANLLRVNDTVLIADGYPRTAELVASRGYAPVALPAAEIAKLDAGLSCMSLRWLSGSGSSDRA
jgi:dimethylargininase